MLFASCINALESSTMKCVLLGLFSVSRRFISATMRRASVSINPSCKTAICAEVPRRKLLPAVLFLLQEKSQRVRVVGDSFKAFKFSVKRIGIACKILSGGYIPCTVFINQTHRIGGKLLVFDALIMPCIVKLIEITFDFPMFCTCQLDCVSKNTVACLFL